MNTLTRSKTSSPNPARDPTAGLTRGGKDLADTYTSSRNHVQRSLIDMIKRDSKKVMQINRITELCQISDGLLAADLSVNTQARRSIHADLHLPYRKERIKEKRRGEAKRNNDVVIGSIEENVIAENTEDNEKKYEKKKIEADISMSIVDTINSMIISANDKQVTRLLKSLMFDHRKFEYMKQRIIHKDEETFHNLVTQKFKAFFTEINKKYVHNSIKDCNSKRPQIKTARAEYLAMCQKAEALRDYFLLPLSVERMVEFFARLSSRGVLYLGKKINEKDDLLWAQDKLKEKYGIGNAFSVFSTIDKIKGPGEFANVIANKKAAIRLAQEEAIVNNKKSHNISKSHRIVSRSSNLVRNLSNTFNNDDTFRKTNNTRSFQMTSSDKFRENLLRNDRKLKTELITTKNSFFSLHSPKRSLNILNDLNRLDLSINNHQEGALDINTTFLDFSPLPSANLFPSSSPSHPPAPLPSAHPVDPSRLQASVHAFAQAVSSTDADQKMILMRLREKYSYLSQVAREGRRYLPNTHYLRPYLMDKNKVVKNLVEDNPNDRLMDEPSDNFLLPEDKLPLTQAEGSSASCQQQDPGQQTTSTSPNVYSQQGVSTLLPSTHKRKLTQKYYRGSSLPKISPLLTRPASPLASFVSKYNSTVESNNQISRSFNTLITQYMHGEEGMGALPSKVKERKARKELIRDTL
jgi:hypothetical protein